MFGKYKSVAPDMAEDEDVARERQRVSDGHTGMDVVTVNSLSKSYAKHVWQWWKVRDV